METLSHNDILALNRAIGEIYAARDMESFYKTAFSSVLKNIPADTCSFNEVDISFPAILSGIHASDDHQQTFIKLRHVLNEHIVEHPFCSHLLSEDVIQTTDIVTREKFKGLALYNEYYRHLDIDSQVVMFFGGVRDRRTLFALSRKGGDFTERDRLMLLLLRPHIINAMRNVTELGRMILERDLLQKGTEAEKQGALLFQTDGTVLCMSPLAKEMISRYFDAPLAEGDTLPGRLLQWFKAEANPPAKGGNLNRVEREPLTIEKDDRCLKIRLLNDFTTGDYILLMTERDDSVILQNLQCYSLSCRETEVLKLLSLGKTNAEIAVILGMSRRTVEKHLEHIFEKLGVETRAAAAAMIQK